jgi:hypothetical protein
MVCRDAGHDLMISVNSSEKPSDSILSASSRTKISSVSSAKECELCKWSMRRPGVAIMISGRLRNATSCDLTDSPPVQIFEQQSKKHPREHIPTIRQKRISVWAASFVPTSKHWAANSLVGTRTRHLVATAFCPRSRYSNRSSIGMINAAVFPEPVTAPPTTSLPKSATGIVATWIGVGLLKPTVVRALRIGRDRFMVRKDV